jgi:hypothetical protein
MASRFVPVTDKKFFSKIRYDFLLLMHVNEWMSYECSEYMPVSSIYIWSKNFSHSAYEKRWSQDGGHYHWRPIAMKVIKIFNTIYLQLIPTSPANSVSLNKLSVHKTVVLFFKSMSKCEISAHSPRWSNLAKLLPLVRARIVSGHLTESRQFCAKCKSFNFSAQVRWKCEPAVLGENLLNMTSVY